MIEFEATPVRDHAAEALDRKKAFKVLGESALAAGAIIGGVPNQPKTPVSNFRLPTDLKTRAATKAAEEGRTLTSVIVEKLEEYVEE